MRFVRPKLLDVLICLAIIVFIASLGSTGDPTLRPLVNMLKIKERARSAQRAGHPLQRNDVQSIVANSN